MTSTERRIQTLLRRAGTARSRDFVAAGITRSQLARMAAGQLVRAARGEDFNLVLTRYAVTTVTSAT